MSHPRYPQNQKHVFAMKRHVKTRYPTAVYFKAYVLARRDDHIAQAAHEYCDAPLTPVIAPWLWIPVAAVQFGAKPN